MTLRHRVTIFIVGVVAVVAAPLTASAQGVSEWVVEGGGTFFQDDGMMLVVPSIEAFCLQGDSPADVHYVSTPTGRTHAQNHIEGDVTMYAWDGSALGFVGVWCPVIVGGGSGPAPLMAGTGVTDLFVTFTDVTHVRAHTRASMVDTAGQVRRVQAQVDVVVEPGSEPSPRREWIRVR